MTIWAFGDSFIGLGLNRPSFRADNEKGIHPWTVALGHHFNQEVKNFGLGGSSLDYTYHQFREQRNNIRHSDILIIVLTDIDRRWLFSERPRAGILSDPRIFNYFPPEYQTAVKHYLLYLNNTQVYETYLIDFLYNVHSLTKELNLHTIVLPAMVNEARILEEHRKYFPAFQHSEGCLTEINRKQYTPELFKKIHSDFKCDGLINHLIWSNHKVLTRKIIQNTQFRKGIDLNNGYYENVVSEETLKDPEFVKNEYSADPIFFNLKIK